MLGEPNVTYRSQEDALRAQLESEKARSKELAEERDRLLSRAEHAEAKAKLYRQLIGVSTWESVRGWIGAVALLGVAAFVLAFSIAVYGDDRVAERVVLISVASFLFGPMMAWARANRPVAGIVFLLFKSGLVAIAAVTWGFFLPYDEQPWEAFRFFYWTPAGLCAFTIVEALLLWAGGTVQSAVES